MKEDFRSWEEVKDCLAFTIFIGWPIGLTGMFGITILALWTRGVTIAF